MDEIVRRLRDNPNYKFKGEKKEIFLNSKLAVIALKSEKSMSAFP